MGVLSERPVALQRLEAREGPLPSIPFLQHPGSSPLARVLCGVLVFSENSRILEEPLGHSDHMEENAKWEPGPCPLQPQGVSTQGHKPAAQLTRTALRGLIVQLAMAFLSICIPWGAGHYQEEVP